MVDVTAWHFPCHKLRARRRVRGRITTKDGSLSRRSSVSSPLRADGVSSHSLSIRKLSEDDGELYMAGQGLVPVVNNPSAIHRSNSGSYGILSWPASAADKAWAEASLPPPISGHRDITYADFDDYRLRVGTMMDRYMNRRMYVQQDNARRLSVTEPEGNGYLRGEGLVQALRQVPSLYFQEDFALTRSDTFAQVIRGETPEARNNTLESLTGFLDIVETELLNEIAARSDSFFEAAESLQELHQSMGDTLFQIQRLQIHSRSIDKGMCSRADHIQSLHRKQQNLKATLELLREIESVTHAQDAVNLLMLAHDYSSALDLVDDLKQQYENETGSGMVAQGIERLTCIKNAPMELEASVTSLRDCLIGELLELLNWNEGESVLRTVAARTLGEESRIVSSPTTLVSTDALSAKREKLKQILVVCSRTGTVSGAFLEILPHAVSRLTALLRNLMEILVPNFVQSASLDCQPRQERSWTESLQYISHDMFLALLNACYDVTYTCVSHYTQLGELLLEAADDEMLIQHRSTIDKGKSDLCQALLDAFQNQWLQLFQTRSEAHQKLSLSQLAQLVETNDKSGRISAVGHATTVYRVQSMLQSACKSALEAQRRINLATLQMALDSDTWKSAAVDSTTQHVITQTFSSNENEPDEIEKADSFLKLNGVDYRAAHSVSSLSIMISDALRVLRTLPEFVTDIGRQMVELLMLFNKRSCQLVLGAQAMQSTGLKSITAKHLAVCSQSILFFIHLHPVIASAVLEDCPATKISILQPEFDRVRQDLVVHLDGIHSKLIGIMKERVLLGVDQMQSELRTIDKQPTMDEEIAPSQAMQQISKQLRILTQVLTPILHREQMEEICTSVAEIFSSEIGTSLRQMMDSYGMVEKPLDEGTGDSEKTDEDCIHPLSPIKPQSPKDEGVKHQQLRRDRIKADCDLLIETLTKLPVGEKFSEALQPLQLIVTRLETV